MPAKKTSKKKLTKKKKTSNAKHEEIKLDINPKVSEIPSEVPTVEDKPTKIRKIRIDKIDFHSKKLHTTLVWIAIILPTLIIGV